jgi:lia operon protein LiaG
MNNTLKKVVWITTAVAVVSLGIASVLFVATEMRGLWEPGNGIKVDERKTYSVNGIGSIEVQTSSTDVYVAAGDEETIDLRLHGTVHTSQADAIPTLAASQNRESLEISTRRKDGRKWVMSFFSSDLILEIRVPEQYRGALIVDTSSGDVEITDQELSELSVLTSSGDMRLYAIRASTITMESSSGDHTADGLYAGQATMTSSSGEIRVRDLQGGAKAKSSSGDISLHYGAFTSDLDVESSSGDVELFLTEAAEFHVQARASSGDIDCAYPVTFSGTNNEMRKSRLYGTVGGGTQRVSVNTSSGDITIRP